MICANEAVDWIGARKNTDNPFILTLWTHEPHEHQFIEHEHGLNELVVAISGKCQICW